MSVIIAMCLYALSMSLSPGPTTIIAMSTGVNHGFKQSFPFIIGATIGFTTLLSIVGLGLGEFAAENKLFLNILGVLGSGFIGYMGFKIATSTKDIHTSEGDRPGLVDGAILQFVNAKA
ncbi:MAG: LysE family transporter, partial [Kordiimonadaceae bacterium]|nr:LysE family transporter [Kordiimonadaceae bacterium]